MVRYPPKGVWSPRPYLFQLMGAWSLAGIPEESKGLRCWRRGDRNRVTVWDCAVSTDTALPTHTHLTRKHEDPRPAPKKSTSFIPITPRAKHLGGQGADFFKIV